MPSLLWEFVAHISHARLHNVYSATQTTLILHYNAMNIKYTTVISERSIRVETQQISSSGWRWLVYGELKGYHSLYATHWEMDW